MGAQQLKYFNFKKDLKDKAQLLTLDQISKITVDGPAYMSIYSYTDKHKEQFEKTGSLAGMKDLTSDVLVWDFDSTNPELARLDTVELANRLVSKGVDPDSINCYWSGHKGLHVVLPLDRSVTPSEFKKATAELAKGLNTFDTVVSDPNRILRLEHSRHEKSGLYKVPLALYEVDEMNVDQIRELAKAPREDFVAPEARPVSLPAYLFATKEKEKKEVSMNAEKFDPKTTPRGWKDYKWALAMGHFEAGERHQALMVVAATCRGLGYDRTTTYHICKAAIEKQADRTGEDKFQKEELYTNIIEGSVFSDTWQGGQYSPDTNPWLKKYCERMGFNANDKEEQSVVNLDDLVTQFTSYSINFEHNVIKTGIADLDEHIIFSTSTLNGILGNPGSGKTTVAIEYLRNASANGVPSMFFSLDMGPPLVFSKLVGKETGKGFKDILKLFREEPKKAQEVAAIIKEKYKNVGMTFKCGVTVADIRNNIVQQAEKTGVKPKLIVVDYLENIAGPYSDANANAGMITNQLKDMATELEVCVILLLQTQKHSTPDVSDPLLSMKQIKGASAIEQNCSVVLTLWREGYSPDTTNDDSYISFALVKNRFGSLGRWDYHWDPIKGIIRGMTDEEWDHFEKFKNKKRQKKASEALEKAEWK